MFVCISVFVFVCVYIIYVYVTLSVSVVCGLCEHERECHAHHTYVSQRTGTAVKCIGPGFDLVSDKLMSFTKPMLEQLAQFHAKVSADPVLAKGFNAIGLSQGNLVLRAYGRLCVC
jgi:palmitoyl-protein thioesterase